MDLAKGHHEGHQKHLRKENKCDRLVMVWCGSTEIYIQESAVHQSLAALEKNEGGKPQGHTAFNVVCLCSYQNGSAIYQRSSQSFLRYSSIG